MLATALAIMAAQTGPPPLVRTVVPSAWEVSDGGDYVAALTRNDSGSIFGMICGNLCVLYANFQLGCSDGEQYTAMVNARGGSFVVTLRCYNLDGRFIVTTPLNDNFIQMLGEGGEVGFAIPLQSGRFAVSRFSLAGALNATQRAAQIAEDRINAGQQGLRDFTI